MTAARTPASGSPPTVWIVLPTSEPVGQADELAVRLRDRGATVFGPTADLPDRDVDVVLPVVPDRDGDQLPDSVPGFEGSLSPWQERLVPVVVGARAAAAFPEVSQLVLGQLGAARTVEKILQVARVGGASLAEIFRLSAAAERWDSAGRPASLLLRSSVLESAVPLLAPASSLEQATVFREYVAASSAHRRRRNRRLSAAATVAILVLALVSVTAFTQQRSAAVATDDFHDRQSHAQSVRLAGLATDLIGIDPDLPWVLVQQALAAADTPEAEDAARAVLDAVPPHRTIELTGLASGMSSDAASDRVAVAYVDGRTEVRSGSDGGIELDVPAEGEPAPTAAALAPGGASVAIQGTAVRLVDVPSGEPLGTLDDEVFWGWVDATRVLISEDGRLTLLDVRSGTRQTLQATVAAGKDSRRAFSVSANGRVATLLDGEDVVSLDLRDGAALPAVPVPDAMDVATDADGRTAMVVTSGGGAVLVTRNGMALEVEDATGFGEHVTAATDGYLMSSGSGQVQLVQATQRAAARLFTAHRGPATGVGEVADGRLATVGADRYLRIWDLSGQLLSYPQNGTGPDLLPRLSPRAYESFRPLIALDAEAQQLTYTFQLPGLVGTVDAATLEPVGETANFGEITTLTRPLPAAGRMVVVTDAGYSALWDIEGSAPRWACRDGGERTLVAMLLGSSNDGERLALASPFALVSWDADDCSYVRTEYAGQRQQPVVVLVDDEHHASTVTTAGTWWREGERPVALTAPGESVTAAALGPDGTLFYVTGSGDLFCRRDDRSERIGRVPAGLAAFALRPSADGELVGVIGRDRTVVLAADTGRVAMDLAPGPRDGAAVRDLALSGSTVWVMRADDAIVRRTVLNDEDVAAELNDRLPRSLTDDESASLADETTIGER